MHKQVLCVINVVVLLLGLGSVSPVAAHTRMTASVPTDGAVLTEAPEAIELKFGAPMRLTSLVLKDSNGEIPVELPKTDTAATARVSIPALDNGKYSVAWRALGGDGHVMSGEFSFTITVD